MINREPIVEGSGDDPASGTNLTFDTLLEALKSAEMLVRQGYQTYDFIH